MKQIEPISIWNNGEVKEATLLDARIINDDLVSSCTFYWTLNNEEKIQIAQGNCNMSGEDYQLWDNSNEEAYIYIANQLKVTLL